MQYLITFLEGFISFISPCLLPMLPIYFSFLAGSMKEEDSHHRLIKNSAFSVSGPLCRNIRRPSEKISDRPESGLRYFYPHSWA